MLGRLEILMGTFLLVVAAGMGKPTHVLAQAEKYQTAEEAYRVGAAFFSTKNYAAAQEPLEAAVRLAKDKALQVKIYRALMIVYRQEKGTEKMIEAAEFILDNSSNAAERSLTRRAYLSFAYQRAAIPDLISRYEKQLKTNPNDRTALFLLTEIYSKTRENPERAAELIERLAKLEQGADQPLDVRTSAQLAQQYVKAKKFVEGAELFEKIAPLDESLAAWHWKEAAVAWKLAGEKSKALAAARESADSSPEKRSELLTHFWHRALGEVFLEAGDPKSAVPHLEQAIASTNIEGYKKSCEEKLALAREQVK